MTNDDKYDNRLESTSRGGSVPRPDPTLLTTEALMREVAALRELLELRITAVTEQFDEHLRGIVAVREQEFAAVYDKLGLVEQQRVEQKSDTKAAVDAALTAQKEAVREQTTASERAIAKSEAATTKQLEQLQASFATAFEGVSTLISDMKERIGAVESKAEGRLQHQEGGHQASTAIYALAGFMLTILIIGGIVAAVVAGK